MRSILIIRLLILLKIKITGLNNFTNSSINGATIRAVLSVFFIANILGVISQKISTNKAVKNVDTNIPNLNPNRLTQTAVAIAEIAMLTKLLPTRIAIINLSRFETKRWMLLDLFNPIANI